MVWKCQRCTLDNDDVKTNCDVCHARKQVLMPDVPIELIDPVVDLTNTRNSKDFNLISFDERVLIPPTIPSTRPSGTSFSSSASISDASFSQKKRTNTYPVCSSDDAFPGNEVQRNEGVNNRVFIPTISSINELCFVDDHFGGKTLL